MRHTIRWGSALLLAAALVIPADAFAQRAGEFQVSPRLSYVAWDAAAAIQDPLLSGGDCHFPFFGQTCAPGTNNLMAGISALYAVADQFAIGFGVDFARPVTNGAYFPAASLEIAGEEELTFVNQRITVLQAGVEGEFSPLIGSARFSPFLIGGLGGYLVYKDAQKSDGFERFGDVMFSVGGGIDFMLGAASGFRLEVRDVIYTGWERSQLNATNPDFQTNLFPELVPAPPEESGTLHNLRLAIGFIFVPGGGS